MKKVLSLFKDRTLKLTEDKSGNMRARFKDTKVFVFPNTGPGDVKNDGVGNMLKFVRLQTVDHEALCISKKVRSGGGRALTHSFVWLSDEALYALYSLLHNYFTDTVKVEYQVPMKEIIESWPKGLSDKELADKLNEMELPFNIWQESFDYYKTLNP